MSCSLFSFFLLFTSITHVNGTTLLFIVQSLSCVWLSVTPWTAARQASLSFTVSQSLLKLMYIESMMPSNHLILCHPLLLLPSILPSITVFSNDLTLRTSGGQSIGASASASVLPVNIQGSINGTRIAACLWRIPGNDRLYLSRFPSEEFRAHGCYRASVSDWTNEITQVYLGRLV